MIKFNPEQNVLYITDEIEGNSFFCESDSSVIFDIVGLDDTRKLELVINSPGGSVDNALAIKHFLETLSIPPHISITGLAASAATIITCAKNAQVTMQEGSLMMIHEPWTQVAGSKDDLKKVADILDKRIEGMANIYASKTKLETSKLIKMMKDETWMTAKEALDFGFVDEIDSEHEIYASLTGDKLNIGGLDFNCKTYTKLKNFINCQKRGTKMENQEDKALKTSSANQVATAQPIINDCAALIKQFPEITKQIADEAYLKGQKAERERMKELDALACDQHSSYVNRAKYETFEDAKTCAFNILKAQKAQLNDKNQALKDDARAVNTVASVVIEDTVASSSSQREALVQSVLQNMKKNEG